jgi:tetratricopeptide (TPR) repeat protein
MGEAIVGVSAVALALIIAALPIVKLIHWGIDGGVEPGLVIVALFLYGALIVSVMAGPSAIKIAALVLILVSAVLMPVLGSAASGAQLKAMDDERLRSYADALERNPMDPVARIALAEELEKRGDVDQAIEHMEWVLKEFPRLGFQHQRTLDMWKRQCERRGAPDLFYCHMCHAEQFPGTLQCAECGAVFGTAEGMRLQFRLDGGPKTLIRAWIISATIMVMAFALLYALPSIIAGPIIIGLVIVGAVIFLRWVGGDLGKPAD